ncbi:MAG: glycerol-3-phosphate dehydrogenase [Devosia sp.]
MSDSVDLLVIGGGINGAGCARDAAGRGLSVILCEKGDLAEGTSSRSGKYIHGGLRYLEYYEFRLVREALIEREVVLSVAPHLTRPLRLVLIHSPQQRPRWLIRLGLLLYDNLGGRKRIPATKAVDLKRSPDGAMVRDTFTNAFAYYDVWVDDARLVILNALDAARRGAQVLTRTACVSARREDGRWRAVLRDSRTGEDRTVYARAIVNTAGPWVEEVLGNVAGVNTQKHVRLVKGSHIITKRWWEGDHGYVLQARDKRLIFVNPYFDDLALIGTTDIPYHDRPEDVAIDDDEVTYLLEILNDYFKISLAPEDVCDTYSGVRALFDDDSEKGASAVTRDYTFEVDGDVSANGGGGRAPILSAFGGKITTYRKLSEHALEKLVPAFPTMGGAWTAKAPLPGGDIHGEVGDLQRTLAARYSFLSEPLAHHYAICYGSEADTILAGAQSWDDLGHHFGGLLYEREVRHLCANEWAESADDILLRRTKHGLFLSDAEAAALADWLHQAKA